MLRWLFLLIVMPFTSGCVLLDNLTSTAICPLPFWDVSRPEGAIPLTSDDELMQQRILEIVPLGTPTETAKAIMEANGFHCTDNPKSKICDRERIQGPYLLCEADQSKNGWGLKVRVFLHYWHGKPISDVIVRHEVHLM